MVIGFFLLLVLFLAGFLNIYFYLPSKKLYAWLLSFFFTNKNSSSSSSSSSSSIITAKALASTSQVPNKEKSNCTSNINYEINKKDELKSVFATFDKNGDGFITKQELKDSLKNMRIFMSDKEVGETVMKVDSNGDGLIDFEEFCNLCESLAVATSDQHSFGDEEGIKSEDQNVQLEGDLKEAFDVFDRDKDGVISVEELGLVLSSLGLKEGKRVEDCKEIIKKIDMDGDGMVNFDEFKKMMRSGSTKLFPGS